MRSVQNIENMYFTECIKGIIQNAGTPSLGSASPVLVMMRGDVRGRLATLVGSSRHGYTDKGKGRKID